MVCARCFSVIRKCVCGVSECVCVCIYVVAVVAAAVD